MMSRCYDIVCPDCSVGLWIGQERASGKFYLYAAPQNQGQLAEFLQTHAGHRLEFDYDESLTAKYDYIRTHD